MWLLLAILFGVSDVVAGLSWLIPIKASTNITTVSITANEPAQPQASATSLSVTKTASAFTESSAIATTTLPSPSNWNATTQAPLSASVCSANCNFTLPVENAGSWKRCEGHEDAIYFAGSVRYVVDRLRNKTMTTTIYAGKVTYRINGTATTAEASDVMNNGSFVYSRADVNEAGTVTAAYYDGFISARQVMYVHSSHLEHLDQY